jgi:hypothetical protein
MRKPTWRVKVRVWWGEWLHKRRLRKYLRVKTRRRIP